LDILKCPKSKNEKKFQKKNEFLYYMEYNKFINALNNPENEDIKMITLQEIKNIKNDILQQLPVSGKIIKSWHNILKNYKYCSEIDNIKLGCFIKWISLKNETINLKNVAACVMAIKEVDENNKIYITCRIGKRFFNIIFSENLIFQKLTQQEDIILNVIDYYLSH